MKENNHTPHLKVHIAKKSYREPTKLSINEIRKILNNKSLTDEQIVKIRDFAYTFGELFYKHITKRALPIQINEHEESHTIHPSEYRRAS